jgi:hypothetical protein
VDGILSAGSNDDIGGDLTVTGVIVENYKNES